MGLTWIDARINGASEEEQSIDRKEQQMGKIIITKKRLYDTDAHGITFLAYPEGAEVPAAEYNRLNSRSAPVETMRRHPAENKAEKPLKQMNKAELIDVATSKGLDVNEQMTNRELMEVIQAPPAAPGADDVDTDEADEADIASGDEE